MFKHTQLLPLVVLFLAVLACQGAVSPTVVPPPPEPSPQVEPPTGEATQAPPATRPPSATQPPSPGSPGQLNPNPPAAPVRLIFIHHSCGENWLADENGGLGLALRDNHYFVSDTNYGWGPDGIGDTTDIGHWYNWFVGPNHETILNAVYAEDGQNSGYSRLDQSPGGENEIVMFKSCFPNSGLEGRPDDPPTAGDNPLRGQECCSENHTVANAKGIYNDLLTYMASRQDKLFIAITAPPLVESSTSPEQAANARAFNRWLVNDWLANYAHNNVAVFDFYNVLTARDNHHRYQNGAIEYITDKGNNYAAYGQDDDSHPNEAGNRKATGEFIPLLNIAFHCWKGDGGCPLLMGRSAR